MSPTQSRKWVKGRRPLQGAGTASLPESRGRVSGALPRKEVAIHAEGKSTGKCEGIRIADARHGDYDAGHLLLQVSEPFFHRRRQRYGGHFEPLYSELHQWRFRHADQRLAAHRRLHCARQGLRRTHDVCQPADVRSDVGAGAHHSDERADDLPAPHGTDFRRQPACRSARRFSSISTRPPAARTLSP